MNERQDLAQPPAPNSGSSLAGNASPVTPESVIEALLFSTDEPLPGTRIAQILGTGDANDVKRHVDRLNERYERAGGSFRIAAIAKGYQMLTQPAYNPWIKKLHKEREDSRLSSAALETLAIVAYKQPVLRADVEAIRGVAVGDMLVRLRDMNLVRIVGRAEEIGRPLLYGTTTHFLEVFGLASLKDLPRLDTENPDAVPKLAPVN
jgi:segregation and condensation protein B